MSLCINPVCPQPHHPNHQNRFCQSCGSSLELLGRYRVLSLLSDKTGFSKLYAATAENTPKILKVLNQELSNDPQAVELFSQEASILSTLNNPVIPKFEEYFQYETRNGLILHCMIMETMEQPNLDVWLEQQNTFLSPGDAVDWLKQFLPNNVPPTPPLKKKKVPLGRLFAALLVSLGILGLIALFIYSPQFTTLTASRQSPQRKGTVDYFPYQEGMDSQGKIAQFNIAVLSVKYKWVTGSNFQVQDDGEIISLDVLNLKLQQDNIQEIMEAPSEIIAVGVASCGGKIGVKERLALERSRQIQRLATRLFENTPSVKGYRLLNLGQFQGGDCDQNQDLTAYQRSVMIIGVKEVPPGLILDEALRDRLANKPFADFKLENYSLGSIKDFKTLVSK
ncbi:inactive serine/threonine-protein kinase VRK3 [Anabaenopsis elenkinii]|jgi:hypothetical protein|uniref:Serine/threonine protein kinase n=1 Tax=Anabaenopsis elenkinii CCIBt3563 TaxID=2779889 RepID=A0A7S6RER6_9CYAN|nr:inactive serine/threonine-protein kinase VRK3 [Anabaenopsis elenkinii]QOV23571.1 serine/threonine protein kinase [Anabaenopsis elenkinii CCIBt3563]